jgi:hypothetical protein
MEESYRKGLANHPDPESCVASRKAAIEALTGAMNIVPTTGTIIDTEDPHS